MLDTPSNGRYYGGMISAPVGAQIMTEILPYLGYEPQYSEEELKKLSVSIPEITGMSTEEAKNKIRALGLAYKTVGTGETVTKQLPTAGSQVNGSGTVIIYTDDSAEQTTTVPNFIGLSVTEANSTAADAGINIEFSGNTTASGLKAYTQSVEAGQSVTMGTIVTVYFREETAAD